MFGCTATARDRPRHGAGLFGLGGFPSKEDGALEGLGEGLLRGGSTHAYVGVRPLVDVMLLLFMVTSLSQRARRAVGDWGTLPYQVALAAGVLVAAASEGRGLALTVHDSGQLGRASIDPYLVVGGVLAGTALVLAIGWILGQYALCTSPVTGWLILYAADLLDRWQYRWTTAWDRVSPHEWASIWPFAAKMSGHPSRS